jgi:hypothetical protein
LEEQNCTENQDIQIAAPHLDLRSSPEARLTDKHGKLLQKKKEEDTTEHILLQYVQARQAWYICSQLAPIAPVQDSKLNDWWLLARRRFSYQDRRVFDTFVSCVGIDLVDTRQMDWHNTTMPPASVSGVAAQQEQIYILSYFFVFSFFLKNIKKT